MLIDYTHLMSARSQLISFFFLDEAIIFRCFNRQKLSAIQTAWLMNQALSALAPSFKFRDLDKISR